jgi:hypothetical protein
MIGKKGGTAFLRCEVTLLEQAAISERRDEVAYCPEADMRAASSL